MGQHPLQHEQKPITVYIIRNADHRPSTQASYTTGRVQPNKENSVVFLYLMFSLQYVELLETIFTQLKFASPAQYVIATFSLAMANDNSRVIKSRCELGCILASKLCDIYEKIEHQDKIICRLESELEGYR